MIFHTCTKIIRTCMKIIHTRTMINQICMNDRPDLYDDMTDMYNDMKYVYGYHRHVWYHSVRGDSIARNIGTKMVIDKCRNYHLYWLQFDNSSKTIKSNWYLATLFYIYYLDQPHEPTIRNLWRKRTESSEVLSLLCPLLYHGLCITICHQQVWLY